MGDSLRVLAVGSRESSDLVRHALRLRPHSHLLVASNYWELCSLSVREAKQVSIAVVDLRDSEREVLRAAEQIRRRWPEAQILLMGPETNLPEDPLYDERISPGLKAAELLAAMERLVKGKQRSKRFRKHGA
jgi:hypothetical protein